MASYTFDLALVKYYRESLDEYATFMPFKIANTKDQTFYAKISIINQGNLTWSLEDNGNLVTEKTYTINANSVLSLNEKLVASTAPTETQKDQIQILVEYFKDDALTQKFGEDTITVNIHCYIQNSDYTWSSTAYMEEQVVFDTFDFTGVNYTNFGSFDVAGVNNNAVFRCARYYSEATYTASGSGSEIEFTSYKMDLRTMFYLADLSQKLTEKFVSLIVEGIYNGGQHNFHAMLPYYTIDDTPPYETLASSKILHLHGNTTAKIVALPYTNRTLMTILQSWDGLNTWKLKDIFIFNKLP